MALSREALIQLALEQWHEDSTKFLLATCLVGLWYAAVTSAKGKSEATLVGLYFALTWLIAIVTSLNSGAGNNYYLEPRAACALALPFGISAFAQFWNRTALPVRVFLFAAVLLSFGLQPLMWISAISRARQDQQATKAIAQTVRGRKVLSTESYFAALSSEPEMLDPYLITQLEMRGRWSSEPILRKVSENQYDLVVFRLMDGKVKPWHGYFHFDDAITAAIEDNYAPFCANAKFLLLVPNSRSSLTDRTDAQIAGCRRISSAAELGVKQTPRQRGWLFAFSYP